MATQETETKKKPNKVIPIILGIILIGGVIFGIKEYIYFSKHVDTDDAQIDGDISPVVARVGGYVDSIFFEENTHVKKDQLLVKIDDRDYKVKVEQAIAAQQGASAGINVGQSQIYSTAANSASAKAEAESAKARLEKVRKDYARYANLVQDGSVTRQQFDQAKADLQVAQANYQAALDQYKAAQQQVGTTRSQLKVTNTGVTARQAEVDFAKLQLSYTNIKSPASGLAAKKNVQVGQLVQAGQTLFSVVNDNSLYITANFKETQLEHIRNGQKVDVKVDAYPDLKIDGQVYNFSPATGAKFSLLPPDNATGNFVKVVQRIPVKIKLSGSKEDIAKLRPGMSVDVSVIIKD
ncbi:HlyD family secretion protein [Mucilaginibacter achroorhodeus]|uniref:HlyD family secretion protein n=1 Tax=Mucilaginibacter achroorhodeus TaxID=2599294 RepID=A0A563TX52_9SPHI|nr:MULTISPECIES: HlyD family secretion protein [Mucilaginibacter]QXV65811.1 HlyD family secretion protein [Mucilaginibacter sp. 21P]TWR23948.1 HlyD family secretion protein [Mucilaginibacter achroorhodeus]